MNELLQKHGCANVFSVPEGLKELMSDITREVLREQPEKIFDFIANYLSVLLVTREHGILAVRILEDLCDCRPSVSEHLLQIGMHRDQAEPLSQVIKEEVEGFEPVEGKEKVKEMQIVKKILTKTILDEDMTAKVCQVIRNAYRDYWYRKKLMEQHLKVEADEPWEIAAERTLALYKKTKPSFDEINRATQKIQAAYRGYYVRKNLLRHLKPKTKKKTPKVELLGPPVDVAASREIDLGPVIDIKVREDDVVGMFDKQTGKKLGLQYDPMRTITHIDDEEYMEEQGQPSRRSTTASRVSIVSKTSRMDAKSRQSRMDVDYEPSEIAPRDSRLPSQVPMSQPSSMHKISFAEVSPEIIPAEVPPEELQAPEEGAEVVAAEEGQIADNPPAEGLLTEAPTVEGPQADVFEEPTPGDTATQEIPEDIPDERTDGDGRSTPTESAPSTAPETANTTDVEDAGDITEEGEELV